MVDILDKPIVLFVDDEPYFSKQLTQELSREGYSVIAVENARDFRRELVKLRPDVVLLDMRLPESPGAPLEDDLGLRLLQEVTESSPELPVIMLTAFAQVSRAVLAMQRGATDFCEKPLDMTVFKYKLSEAAQRSKLLRENKRLREQVRQNMGLIGESPAMRKVWQLIQNAAPTKARILLTGETGTGKSLVAKIIHRLSDRNQEPLVKLNCTAISPSLIESELFGHMRGSFTGATGDRKGVFERAHKGTLFLDEIGDMDLGLQAKLLNAIQDGEITRLGGAQTIPVDVRLISATNKSIDQLVREKKFREDLYYRIRGVHIHIPPLRDRPEDIYTIAVCLVDTIAERIGVEARTLSEAALSVLISYPCPGNVRDIENILESVLTIPNEGEITADEIRTTLPDKRKPKNDSPGTLQERIEGITRHEILNALTATHWNVSEAARRLGVSRVTLHRHIHQQKITRGDT
jgi:DNA-binding NtrC family response regulator